MKITAINGSPKERKSMSGALIKQLQNLSTEEIDEYRALDLLEKSGAELGSLTDSEVLIFVFPLYVDSLPACLIELLTRLEKLKFNKETTVYAIGNCGFYEAEQIYPALKMIKHFTLRAGLRWGYGLGIGCGPMVRSFGEDWQKGPPAPVYEALAKFMANVSSQETREDVFVTVKYPRFMYVFSGNISWRIHARKRGTQNLRARPHKDGG